jgi:uncharacterized protein involved in exopolysaccharide biosynthesis
MELHYYWRIFRRHLPYVVILTAIGAIVGVAIALALPPVYKSQATLIVESEQIPDELAATTVRTGEIEALEIIRQRILSREILLDLANDQNLYADNPGMIADEKVKDLRDRINIDTVRTQVRRGERSATIVTVSFESSNAQKSAQTTNEVVTLILQENVRMRTNVARQTLDFFTQETERLEQALSQISAQILQFQEQNLEALPDSLEFRRSQQNALQERILQLEREKSALQDRRQQLITLFETTGQINFNDRRSPAAAITSQARPEEIQLAELRREYARLSATLSETNPRMTLLQSRIEAAEAAVAALPPRAAPLIDTSDRSLEMSLFDIQIADIDAQIGYIEDQRVAAEERMERISRTIEATPGNTVTLAAMERDYQNLQEQYNQAVANKARAETGSMIESLSRGQRISVVEQAVPAEQPTSPNRPIIATSGLMGGMFLGLLLFAMRELLNNAVRRPRDLENGLQISAFATIPYMTTQSERMRRRTTVLGIALLICVGVPSTLWYVDQHVAPLAPILERVLDRVGLGQLI